ncbi:MAG: lipopolysaccharide biosynthesis protein, partial [Terriglobia bacterium]
MSTEPVISSSLLVWNQVKQAFLRTEKAQLLARGSVATVVLRACSLGLKMLVGILFARMLSAKGYGVYAYAVAWLATLMIPTTLGLDHVLLRYVSAYKETRSWSALKGLLQFATQRAVAAAVVVSFFSIAIVAMLSGKDWDFRVTMWITLALLPIVVILQLQQASLRGLDHPVLARLPENIVYPVLLLTFAAGAYFIVGTTLTVPQAALANGTAWVAAFVLGTLFVLFKLPEPVRTSGRTYEKSAWMAMIPPLIF